MELIDPIWTFAAEWKIRLLVLIVLANMILALRLYGVMSRKRFKAAKEGRVNTETYRATQNEPEDVAVFNRAVVNQFESPVLFYAIIAMSMALNVSSWLTVALAAAYVSVRWQHAHELIGEPAVLTRRKLFIRAFYVLLSIMAAFAPSPLLRARSR